MRILSLVLRLSLSLLLLISLVTVVIIGTESGTQALLAQVSNSTATEDFELTLHGVSGSLLRQVNAERVSVRLGDSLYEITDVVSKVSLLALLSNELIIQQFSGSYTTQSKDIGNPSVYFSSQGVIDLTANHHLDIEWRVDPTSELESLLAPVTSLNSQENFWLSGKATISGSLESISIEHELLSPVPITSSGTVNPSELSYTFDHFSEQIVLRREEAALFLLSTRLTTVGDTSNLEAELTTELVANRADEGELSLQSFAPSAASANNLSLNSSIAFANRSANFSVFVQTPDLLTTVFSNLALSSFNLGPLTMAGRLNQTPLGTTALTIETLATSIDGTPLTASSRLEASANGLTIERLEIATAGNSITATGSANDGLNLDFIVNITDWDEFVPGASGTLLGEGHLSGTASSPIATVAIAGSRIGYKSYSIEAISLMATVDAAVFDGTFSLKDAVLFGDAQDPINVEGKAKGSPSDHALSFNLTSALASIELSLQGGLPLPLKPGATPAWKGTAEFGRVRYIPAGAPWILDTPTALTLGRSTVIIPPSCWLQGTAATCIEFTLNDAQRHAQITLEKLPIATLIGLAKIPALDIFIERYGAAGMIDASIDYTESNTAPATIDSVLNADQISFHIDGGNGQQVYAFEEAKLRAAFEEGSWQLESHAILLEKPPVESAQIDSNSDNMTRVASLEAEVRLGADESLFGTLKLRALGLEWLEAFIPDLEALSGQLSAEMAIGGSLGDPTVSATATLLEGAFTLPSLGVRLSGITLNTDMKDSETLTLAARGRSGEGDLSIAVHASRLGLLQRDQQGNELQAEIVVSGSNFLVADNDTLRMTASPNFTARAIGGALHYSGGMSIPLLNITLNELPPNAIDISSDAVLIDAQFDADKATTYLERVTRNGITGELVVELGDDASIAGFGIDTRLAGSLRLQRGDNQSNLAYGELSLLDGTYELYGQSLAIRQGRFVFLGALDNPGVDVRAVTQINAQTVGVQMGGTLKSMNSSLFSSPNLSEIDILAMLATGRPFASIGQRDQGALLGTLASLGLERNSGLTNQIRSGLGLDELSIGTKDTLNNSVLTVGKYLTPNLFARYGVGLFDSSSKVNLDYTLSDRLKLKAESGAQQSIDLVYSVEK